MAKNTCVVKLGTDGNPGSVLVQYMGQEIPHIQKVEVEAEPGMVPIVRLEMMVPEVIIEEVIDEKPAKMVEKKVSSKELPKVVKPLSKDDK